MKKIDRQKVFDKYGGKCAYCGCELAKGWHVDEIEPVRRRTKYIQPHWGEGIRETDECNSHTHPHLQFREWIDGKTIAGGCDYPERFNVDNQNPACASCNINKHSGSLEDFRKLISGFMKHLNEVNTQYKIAKRYGLVIEDIKPVVFYFETLNLPK